jgi:hypothetical protein
VIPQVRVLVNGDYGSEHADDLWRRGSGLDRDRLRLLVQNQRPQVMVLANRYREDWRSALGSESVTFGVFEIFRGAAISELVFRINGYSPPTSGDFVSYVEVDQSIPRLLRVLNPGGVVHRGDGVIPIEVDGAMMDMKIVIEEDQLWLNPVSGNRLDPKQRYVLREVQGKYQLKGAQ